MRLPYFFKNIRHQSEKTLDKEKIIYYNNTL